MIYAQRNAAGEPVEIHPGNHFATYWLKIADAQDAVWSGVPIGTMFLMPEPVQHPQAAFAAYTEEDFARHGIAVFDDPVPPEGQALASYAFGLDGETITLTPTFEVPPVIVPERVSALELQLALDETGDLDAVEAAISAGSRALQIYWAKTDPFERSHPKIAEIGAALGKTDEEIDDLFRLAATKA